jgi:hypothetical protein
MKIPNFFIPSPLLLLYVWALHPFLANASIADEEEYRFDKTKCTPGPHAMDEKSSNQAAPDIFNVRWKTTASEEDIVVQIHRDWAPIGTDRFYNLILDNYYNCAAFFRVVPGQSFWRPIKSSFTKLDFTYLLYSFLQIRICGPIWTCFGTGSDLQVVD